MIRQIKELKNIQAQITKASYSTVINISSVDIDENTIFTEIYYNTSRDELFTNIAFQIYSLLRNNNTEICINQIAEQIIDETKTNNLFVLNAVKGYINIQLSNSLINREINRINKEDFYSEQIDFEECIELFPVWYCINKVETALKYLQDNHTEIDPTKNPYSRSLSLYLIFLDYKEKVTLDELLKYSEHFYQFDRRITVNQIPYSLYKATRLTFANIIWKNKQEKW